MLGILLLVAIVLILIAFVAPFAGIVLGSTIIAILVIIILLVLIFAAYDYYRGRRTTL